MKFSRWFSFRRLALVCACCLAAGALAAAELPAFTPGKQIIQFTESALQSAADEVKSRLHSIEEGFDAIQERFARTMPWIQVIESFRMDAILNAISHPEDRIAARR